MEKGVGHGGADSPASLAELAQHNALMVGVVMYRGNLRISIRDDPRSIN
jgi:hypothetical protein